MRFFCWFLFCFTTTFALAAKPGAIVFDLDDTLFDTNFRTLEILHEIGATHVPQLSQLVTLEYPQVNFFCSVTCRNAGISDAGLIDEVCGNPGKGTLETALWGQKFFSPDYLKYDHVISGAPTFVARAKQETGASIIYLTGRSGKDNRKATEAQLRYFGFPNPGEDGTVLILKGPQDSPSDLVYKTVALDELLQNYRIIGALDDSKDNANMFRSKLASSIPVIRPNRNVADRAGLSPGISQITTYYYNVAIDSSGNRTVVPNSDILEGFLADAKAANAAP